MLSFLILVQKKYTSLDCSPVLLYVPHALVLPFALLVKQLKIVTLKDVCFESKLFPRGTTNGSANVGLSRVRV